MKIFVVIVLILSAYNVFAGPEEHMMDQKCYVISEADYKMASSLVPSEVCLETVNLVLSVSNSKIYVYSYFGQYADNNGVSAHDQLQVSMLEKFSDTCTNPHTNKYNYKLR